MNDDYSLIIDKNSRHYRPIVKDVEKIIKETPNFWVERDYRLMAGISIDEFPYKHDKSLGLEINYNKPVQLKFLNYEVYRMYISFEDQLLYIGKYDDELYQSGAYPLEKTDSLKKYVENLIIEYNIENELLDGWMD